MVALAVIGWMDCVVEIPGVSCLDACVWKTLQPEPLHTVALPPAGKAYKNDKSSSCVKY